MEKVTSITIETINTGIVRCHYIVEWIDSLRIIVGYNITIKIVGKNRHSELMVSDQRIIIRLFDSMRTELKAFTITDLSSAEQFLKTIRTTELIKVLKEE